MKRNDMDDFVLWNKTKVQFSIQQLDWNNKKSYQNEMKIYFDLAKTRRNDQADFRLPKAKQYQNDLWDPFRHIRKP